MDKLKHNLRLNSLLLLLVISSFSLFGQKQTTLNTTATIQNGGSVSTTTTTGQTNTSTASRLILQGLTTETHNIHEINSAGFVISNGVSYNNNVNDSTTVNCPMMYVQVNVPFLQSCIHSSAQINFCNHGTATAFGAFVDVELPTELLLDSTDLPYTIVGTNLYRFQLGTVPVSVCNQFDIYFTTDCDSTLIGEEHCIHAHIYPDTLCNSVQSAPLITVDATCIAGKATFALGNHGTAVTIDQHMQLIIIEDHLIAGGNPTAYLNETLKLESNGTLVHSLPITQSDYKLTLDDGSGNQLIHATINNCYDGSPNVLINTFHAQQHVNQFGNSNVLPSISQGCSINGNSTIQTDAIFAPTVNPNTNSDQTTSNNNENKNDISKFELSESEKTSVLIFPNPFSQNTTVRIDGPLSDHFIFKLYDTMGKTVLLTEIDGLREFQIERGDLLEGMYFYQIEATGKLINTGKLIIK